MVQYILRNNHRLNFFVKCCIQRPFVENNDSTYQDVVFFRRCFVAFGKKKGEAKAGALYHQDVMFCRRHFAAFDGKR